MVPDEGDHHEQSDPCQLPEAREDGETNERLDRAVAWDYAALRARLREHFTDREIGVLTSMVAMINLWNRIQVSRH